MAIALLAALFIHHALAYSLYDDARYVVKMGSAEQWQGTHLIIGPRQVGTYDLSTA